MQPEARVSNICLRLCPDLSVESGIGENIYSQALDCISCSTVFAAMQVYYCMITLIIFFSFSQQICKELDLFDVYHKCHTDKTQEHACLFY